MIRFFLWGELKDAKFPVKERSPTIVLVKTFDGNGVIGNGTDIVTYASTGFRSYSGEKDIHC